MGCKRFFVKERKNDMFLNKTDLPFTLLYSLLFARVSGRCLVPLRVVASMQQVFQKVCFFVTPFPSNFAEYKSNILRFSESFGMPWSLTGYSQ